MTKTEHEEYLGTDHWREFRKLVLEERPTCERCKMPRWLAEIAYDQDLHVHHRHYKTKGHEGREDVEVLCRRCHDLESNGRSDFKSPRRSICTICGDPHWDRRSDYCLNCSPIFNGKHIARVCAIPTPSGFSLSYRQHITWEICRDGSKGTTVAALELIEELLKHAHGAAIMDRWMSEQKKGIDV